MHSENIPLKQYGALAFVLILLAGIGFGANWVYHQFYPNAPSLLFADPNEYVNALNASVSAQTIPQGLRAELANSPLYLMLANRGSAYAQPHVLFNGAFTPLPENRLEDWYYSTSPNGTLLTFFATADQDVGISSSWGAKADLYVVERSSLTGVLSESLEGLQPIETGDIPGKQLPSVSDAGDVLFMGRDEATGEWAVYLADGDSVENIALGFAPKWITDTEFVFIGKNGLYAASTEGGDPRLLDEAEDMQYSSGTRIDVSADGNTLVWSHPDHREIHLYAIQSSPELTLTDRGALPVPATWVAISPNGNYLAALISELGKDNVNMISRIDFFSLESLGGPLSSIPLDAFEPTHILITDWASPVTLNN